MYRNFRNSVEIKSPVNVCTTFAELLRTYMRENVKANNGDVRR